MTEIAREIRADIEAGMVMRNLKRKDLARRTGIPYSTLCQKLNNPMTLGVDDLIRIVRVTGKEIRIRGSE